jgi:hypothetical protein
MARPFLLLCLPALCGSFLQAQVVARLVSAPPLSPEDVARLESQVHLTPNDIDSRVALLRFYTDSAPIPPNDHPAHRAARFRHILYMVEHHPELPASAAAAAYVYRSAGPYANMPDHEAVRSRWLSAAATHPGNTAVTINAAKFLAIENPGDAEDVLRQAVAAYPKNREAAAHLGFFYANEIFFADERAARARAALERSSNAVVLAAAGTALPNLAMRASGGRPVDPKVFELASRLLSRARALAPGDAEVHGPMPMIRYFSKLR